VVRLPKIRWRPNSNTALAIATFTGVVILILTLTMRTQEKDVAVDKANSLGSPILDLCVVGDETSRVLASARTPDGKSLCEAAADVKTDPVTAQVPEIDEARIRELIAAELAKRPNPKQSPDMNQLIEAARTVIAGNPELFRGDPGTPPSPVEIAAVVSTFIRANPEQFRGIPGRDGENGRAGRPGDSFSGLSFARRGAGCAAIVSITTATGGRTESVPVPMNLCQDPPQVTTTVTAPPVTTTVMPTSEPEPDPEPTVTPDPEPSLEPSEPPNEGG
jgi:hypothetical protein